MGHSHDFRVLSLKEILRQAIFYLQRLFYMFQVYPQQISININDQQFKIQSFEFEMLVKLTLLILLSSVSQAFLKNCEVFNVNNQNECTVCRKTFYISNGGCVLCPTGQTTIKQCLYSQNDGKTPQTSAVNLPQSQTLAPSQNKAESILSNLFLQPKTSTTPTVTTALPTFATQPKPVENKVTQQKPNTQTNIPVVPPVTAPIPKKDLTLDINSLIFSYLPFKCIQFKVNPKILCSACQKGYQLTSNNLCQQVKAESAPNPQSLRNIIVTQVQATPPSVSQATPLTSSQTAITTVQKVTNNNHVNNQSPSTTTQQKSETSSVPTSDPSTKISSTTVISTTSQAGPPAPSSTAPLKSITIAQIPITKQDKNNLSVFIPIVPIKSTTKPKQSSPPQDKPTQNPSQEQDKVDRVLPKNQRIYDSNCVRFNQNFNLFKFISPQNQRCLLCYNGFFYDLQKQQCQPFNPLCKTVDEQNNCLSCYLGYDLNNGKCLISQGQNTIAKTIPNSQSNPQTDPNCKQYQTDSSDCIQCSSRYYYDPSKRLCVEVDGSCRTWNETNGYCITCYSGYVCGTTDRVCKPIQTIITDKSNPYDPATLKKFCLKFVNNNCISCVTRSVLMNGVCMPVSDLCMTFDRRFGFCLSCYPGYELNQGICQTPIFNPDPNCGKMTKEGCEYCNPNYFLNEDGICEVVSNLCLGYNRSNGHCLDCFPLYTLQQQTGECTWVV